MPSRPNNPQPLDDHSCPWCFAPAHTFDVSGDRVACRNCDSVIPVEADWYQNGDKIW